MSKRKLDQIGGQNLWDIEWAYNVEHRRINPDNARTFVILRWLCLGDLRPLAAAIDEGHLLDEAVLNVLAGMIKEGRLRLKPRKAGKGRPRNKSPETFARTVAAALPYEHSKHPSEEAFKEIAAALGIGEKSVRQAVTAWRKTWRKRKSNAK